MVPSSSLPTLHGWFSSTQPGLLFRSFSERIGARLQVRWKGSSVENEGEERSSAGRGCVVKLGGKSWHRDEGDAKAGQAFLKLDGGRAK